MALPPGCDQVGSSSTPARRSCFGVPLHVVKDSCTCTPLRVRPHLQFAIWVSTLMPIYADAHIKAQRETTAPCFAALRRLRTESLCLPLGAYKKYKSLIVSVMLCRLDYGNAMKLSGLPDYTSSVVCSASSMQRQGPSSIYTAVGPRILFYFIYLFINQCT